MRLKQARFSFRLKRRRTHLFSGSQVMSLLRARLAVARGKAKCLFGSRSLSTSPARINLMPKSFAAARLQRTQDQSEQRSSMASGSTVALAGSPLFLTDMNVPMYWGEIQFILSGPMNGLVERMFETEAGPLFLNGVFLLTVMRMGVYYGFLQPSYLWHFQERYGQTWTVGHHLYGSDLPNPLKKGK
eukprot:TRINITY_DN2220_c0_g1_i1.p1 TRINITY_DN2220_c0_g1~~TRINITY_DN2220_c0_g1_i1.p1  ORF type:complete len:187 (+),score=33.46 TRINITY_DN2220_c0_g1_i1:253-813(+)